MSQENVEIVRRAAEAFARDDRTAWLALFHPDHEVEPPPDWPDPGVRGAEAAWDYYVSFFDTFEARPLDAAGIVDVGDDKVLLHYRLALSGRASGAGVEFDYWNLITIRQGKISSARWFADRAEALEAAGQPE